MTTSKDVDGKNPKNITVKSYIIIFLIVVAANVATHVLIEFYNDWDAHIEAFEEGMEEAR